MDLVTRGMIRTLKAVFVSHDTGEEFDPSMPTVEIRHYDGAIEIIDLPETAMVKTTTGHYFYNWTVPDIFPLDVAFIYYRGTDASGHRLVIEEKLRVVPTSFYQTDTASDMVVKFTKD